MSITITPTECADPQEMEICNIVENRTDRAKRRSQLRDERLRMLEDPHGNMILVGHWTHDEIAKYMVFLTVYQQNFSLKSLRRTQKIFKEMCKFIRTRTADQCRSHHQKMEKKCETFFNILQYLGNFCPLPEAARQALTEECLSLRKSVFKEERGRGSQVKVEEQKKYLNSQSEDELLVPQIQGGRPSDMSIYLQNGCYVMPIFPCSTYYFYSNYFPPCPAWGMAPPTLPCNKF